MKAIQLTKRQFIGLLDSAFEMGKNDVWKSEAKEWYEKMYKKYRVKDLTEGDER